MTRKDNANLIVLDVELNKLVVLDTVQVSNMHSCSYLALSTVDYKWQQLALRLQTQYGTTQADVH